MEKNIEDYEHLVNTQATADRTGYRELRDWAKDMLYRYEYLTTVLITISTVGAGLVYATIFRFVNLSDYLKPMSDIFLTQFSATRGNVGFMCITFPLFTVGLIVPVTAQICLRWASNLPRAVPFASQTFWRNVLM